jgi:AraC-like DNA-binding protein
VTDNNLWNVETLVARPIKLARISAELGLFRASLQRIFKNMKLGKLHGSVFCE